MTDRKANEDPLITHAENASTKKRGISVKRLLTAAAILGLVALMLPATAGIAVGQGPAHITFTKEVDNSGVGTAVPTDFVMHLVGPTVFMQYKGVSGDTVLVTPGTYALAEDQLANYVKIWGTCWLNGGVLRPL